MKVLVSEGLVRENSSLLFYITIIRHEIFNYWIRKHRLGILGNAT